MYFCFVRNKNNKRIIIYNIIKQTYSAKVLCQKGNSPDYELKWSKNSNKKKVSKH